MKLRPEGWLMVLCAGLAASLAASLFAGLIIEKLEQGKSQDITKALTEQGCTRTEFHSTARSTHPVFICPDGQAYLGNALP